MNFNRATSCCLENEVIAVPSSLNLAILLNWPVGDQLSVAFHLPQFELGCNLVQTGESAPPIPRDAVRRPSFQRGIALAVARHDDLALAPLGDRALRVPQPGDVRIYQFFAEGVDREIERSVRGPVQERIRPDPILPPSALQVRLKIPVNYGGFNALANLRRVPGGTPLTNNEPTAGLAAEVQDVGHSQIQEEHQHHQRLFVPLDDSDEIVLRDNEIGLPDDLLAGLA